MQQPIPAPHPDDDEDVSWALSTASALWSRGEVVESLKWLRRAAETASDANRDMRAVELFKAAAEVATLADNARNSAAPPPSPSQAPSSASSQYPSNQPPNGQQGPASKRPPGPPPRRSGPPGPVVVAAPPTPRTSPLPPPVGTPRPSGPPPLTPRASAPPLAPPAAQTPRPSGLPPQGRVAQPPPPARSSAGSNPGARAPVAAESAKVPLRRGGPAAVAGTRSQRRETATGSKARGQSPNAATPTPPTAAPSGRGGRGPSAASIEDRRAFAEELTSERSTFAGLGAEPRTGDDATTSPNMQRAPLPVDAGAPRESQRGVAKPRREEEITVQRTFFPTEQPPYESARLKPGFDDLDEKTNVATDAPNEAPNESERPRAGERASERPPSSERTLTGMPAPRDVPQSFRPPPSAAPIGDRSENRSANEAHLHSQRSNDAEDIDLRKTNAQPKHFPSDGVTSFKVAVFAEPSRGVQLVLLRPGEPAAEGLVTAFIVPTDQASSDAIAALLRRGNKS